MTHVLPATLWDIRILLRDFRIWDVSHTKQRAVNVVVIICSRLVKRVRDRLNVFLSKRAQVSQNCVHILLHFISPWPIQYTAATFNLRDNKVGLTWMMIELRIVSSNSVWKLRTVRKTDARNISVSSLSATARRMQNEIRDREEAIQSEIPSCQLFRIHSSSSPRLSA